MDKEQSFSLYLQGREKWNKWANAMLAEKKRLQQTGEWEAGQGRWEYAARADFGNHSFSEFTDFGHFVFPGQAQFLDAGFSAGALFSHTKFLRKTDFYRATFSDFVTFVGAIFHDDARFESVTFSKNSLFEDTNFFGKTEFAGSTFVGLTTFMNAIFIANPDIRGAPASIANFVAINSKKYFGLDGARFENVPNFHQAHFLEAPSLDRIIIGPKARENPTRPLPQSPSPHGEPVEPRAGGIKVGGENHSPILRQAQDEGAKQALDEVAQEFKKEEEAKAVNKEIAEKQQIPSRWRHLRRLATQGQDHENEGYFFAEEIKSRRNVFDFPKGKSRQRYWAGWLYQGFSDFGRSILLPLKWWVYGGAVYAYIILGTYLSTAPILRPSFFNDCIMGNSTPWIAAIKIAFDNALFLPQFGVSDGQVQENLCLFAQDNIPNLPPVALVPTWIVGLGAFHTIFSATMIFLILLAIRNQFRIR